LGRGHAISTGSNEERKVSEGQEVCILVKRLHCTNITNISPIQDVVIATPQVTRELTLETGIDNIHIPGSSGNHDYLANLEHYYRVTLEEQSVLIFNNSGCLHHFTNIIEEGVTPIALSNRCKYAYGSDPRGWIHLAGNLNVWYNMADHYVDLMADGEQARKQEKV
jgi:hypothetical protein